VTVLDIADKGEKCSMRQNNGWVIALLVVLVLVSAANGYMSYEERQLRIQNFEETQRLTKLYDQLSTDTTDAFTEMVYGEEVEGIYQQQFVALDYQMEFMKIIIQQNNHLMLLLASQN
jgi:hypothetical protein